MFSKLKIAIWHWSDSKYFGITILLLFIISFIVSSIGGYISYSSERLTEAEKESLKKCAIIVFEELENHRLPTQIGELKDVNITRLTISDNIVEIYDSNRVVVSSKSKVHAGYVEVKKDEEGKKDIKEYHGYVVLQSIILSIVFSVFIWLILVGVYGSIRQFIRNRLEE